MAISATALEIFNTLYPQFGWVILRKFFGGRGWRGVKACAITWVHDAYWFLCLFFFFPLSLLFVPSSSLCHRWTDQSRWSQQTVRVEEVLYAFPSLFSFPLPRYLPSFVPALQTRCLCGSASPLSVPLDDALYLDAGWQRGLAGPSSVQNASCTQRSSWPARPLAPFLEFHHMHWCMHTHAHTQKHGCLVMLEGKAGHFFLSNTFNKAVCNKADPVGLTSQDRIVQMNRRFKWQICVNESGSLVWRFACVVLHWQLRQLKAHFLCLDM